MGSVYSYLCPDPNSIEPNVIGTQTQEQQRRENIAAIAEKRLRTTILTDDERLQLEQERKQDKEEHHRRLWRENMERSSERMLTTSIHKRKDYDKIVIDWRS